MEWVVGFLCLGVWDCLLDVWSSYFTWEPEYQQLASQTAHRAPCCETTPGPFSWLWHHVPRVEDSAGRGGKKPTTASSRGHELSAVVHSETLLQGLTNDASEGGTEVHGGCSETRGKFQSIYQSSAASISRQVEKNNMKQGKKINPYPEHLINKKGVRELLALPGSQSIFVTVQKACKCVSL